MEVLAVWYSSGSEVPSIFKTVAAVDSVELEEYELEEYELELLTSHGRRGSR